jgi:hypothetical protein
MTEHEWCVNCGQEVVLVSYTGLARLFKIMSKVWVHTLTGEPSCGLFARPGGKCE